MSQYLTTLCDSLSKVLDRCAQLDARRLAGYVGNLEFWINEVRHRLKLIDGLIDRRRKMVAATKERYRVETRQASNYRGDSDSIIDRLTDANVADTSTNWDELEELADRLRTQVLGSTKGFIKNCIRSKLLDRKKLFDIEESLGMTFK